MNKYCNIQSDCKLITELEEKLDITSRQYAALQKKEKYLYYFLTNRYNYGSFRPMWGAYLLKHFFDRDLADFFDAKAYEMADTIEEKEKQLGLYKQVLEKIQKICKDGVYDEFKMPLDECAAILKIIEEVINDK